MSISRITRLTTLFTQALSPLCLEILDESPKHARSMTAETHLHILLVSSHFQDQSRVQRHKSVYAQLTPEFEQGLHAVTLNLFTPEEWSARQAQKLHSPACQGHHHDD